MFVSLNWLREFVELPKDIDVSALAQLITIRTAEIDHVIDQSKELTGIIVAKVLEVKKHPDADKLIVAQVDAGKEKLQVVCGGINVKEGMLVALALPGAIVKWHGGEVVEMKIAKVRDVESHGMICASEEIGLGDGPEKEIMDLSYLKVKAGTPLADALGRNDTVFEFDNKSLTHRPDLWGHLGIAREIGAITGYKFTEKKAKIEVPKKGSVPMVTVKNPKLCPRYMGLIIKGVKVGESPDWLKQRLQATGHSVISNIVDVTNYVMEEIGQPLHAFDLRNLEGGIVVRTAKKDEKIVTLDGEEKQLDPLVLVIADEKKALAIAGVMGGEHSGIHADTVDILIESANFDPTSVRLASIKAGLRTDSVQRFEKSLDPKYCKRALLRAAELILELCPGAELAGPFADVSNFETYEPVVEVDPERISKKIGVEISTAEMVKILESLKFEVTREGKILSVKVPSFRATKDVDMEDDIVEEIARMHGYEKIPALVPDLPAKVPHENTERKNEHEIREIFAYALNFNEIYNYSFYSKKIISDFALDEKKHLRMLNALSEDQSHLRISLIPNLAESLHEAAKNEEFPALFEIGKTYSEGLEFMPVEKKVLSAVALFKKEINAFGVMKGKLEEFFYIFGIENAEFIEAKNHAEYIHPHQCAEIKFRNKIIGKIFTLHPLLAEKLDFTDRIAAFELDLSALSAGKKTNIKFAPESKFPSIDFDVSVVIDRKTEVAALRAVIEKAAKPLLKTIELFDSYEGDKIEAGKKSLAFRITLQADDRTLTSADLEHAQHAVWNSLEKIGGHIRK